MKRRAIQMMVLSLFVLGVLMLVSAPSHAAQQYQGLCSYVKIEILQELALERVGFLATLEVTNNEGDASITDFSAALTFQRKGAGGVLEDASDLFFVQPPKLSGVSSINGTGIISPGQTAHVEWFIIPKLTAGGTTPAGLQYQVGALLAGSIYGLEIAQDVLAVLPDTITVKPDPELDITYFQPRDVDGDNPFTLDIVESPIPFTLGVLVKNVGYGEARKLKIVSEQPRIVEDKQGLLVVPQLIGARVDDQPTDNTTLTVNLGNISPGKCRKGAWDMITTLSGEFTEFKASYTHAPELGGEDTSLIRDLNAYFMVHEVLNDQPGRDTLLDFLAETLDGEQLIPDTLFESDCNTLPVNRLTDVQSSSFMGQTAKIQATANIENWVFMRIDDPGQAKYPIKRIVRSDGKVLNPHNYWTNIRYQKPDNTKLTYLNIFDFVSLGTYTYTVTYTSLGSDSQPPVTRMLFSGPSQKKDSTYYLLPETQVFFIADDASPVGTYYKLDGAVEFLPAYPFTIPAAGAHLLEYYSIDIEDNEEAHQMVDLFVAADDPGIANLTTDTSELFIAGDSISVRPTSVTVGFNGVMTASKLEAEVEVYRGVYAYPALSGVPSSPTTNTGATITVGGENVDLYRYHLAGDAWSAEFPVAQPIALSGLSGSVALSVSGRSQHGDYLPDSEAVSVSWTVDPAASPLTISGVPMAPSRSSQASLSVTGDDYYCYRIDGSFYRPEPGLGLSIDLDHLADGLHSLEVLPRAGVGGVCPGDVVGTKASWMVDRLYGLTFPVGTRVRYASLGQVDAAHSEFSWDGRTDSGVVVPPGWYTVKVLLQDGLGRSTAAVSLLYVGDMVAGGALLSDAGNASQNEAHAFAKWAVWQDQRHGSWDIFAQNLHDTALPAVAITNSPLNRERPRTDGKYVVWEDRQADGTWDVWAKDLESAAPAFAITTTPALDEKKPYVYWPWVVYQAKPVANPSAPWQLKSYNMSTKITESVDPTTQDQLDPVIHRQQLVWQDWRDVGPGEIYLKDLHSGGIRRITNNTGGQYHPVIFDHWLVWADNRNTEFDLYGYNLKRDVEVQLTNTPEDETMPYLNGEWVVYGEDSAGEQNINLRLMHLANMANVQLTNGESVKERPSLASNTLLWVDHSSGHQQLMAGAVPDLQPVFNNQNAVAVTSGMVTELADAYTTLSLWHGQAGVSEISRYTSLLPQPVSETVTWVGDGPSGANFALEAGGFLWVKFNNTEILDLGQSVCGTLDLVAGTNVFSFSCFPDQYSAYALIREIGPANIQSVRFLNSGTGLWRTATVADDGGIVGDDFKVPSTAVLLLDMKGDFGPWAPGEGVQ